MGNFHFLDQEFSEIKKLASSAEQYVHTDPRASTIYSRLCLEHTVYWLYEHESELPGLGKLKYLNGDKHLSLDDLMKVREFQELLDDDDLYNSLFEIKHFGNRAVHRSQESVTKAQALTSVELLYNFILELALNYQEVPPEPKAFDAGLLPTSAPVIAQKDQQKLKDSVQELEEELQQLQDQKLQLEEEIAAFNKEREAYRQRRLKNAQRERIKPSAWTEEETRYRLIDVLLMEAGWDLDEPDVKEFEVTQLPVSVFPNGKGKADYVLRDDDHKPLAVIEAKRTIRNPEDGKHQAKLYADGLEKMYGRRPIIFYTNGFTTMLWEDDFYPPGQVMGFLTKAELQWFMHRRINRVHPLSIPINENIVGGQGRSYQLTAVTRTNKRFCDKDQLIGKHRRGLLVMATGAGKTRTAAAIIEVLTKASWVKRVLFLADRNALVDQAKKAIAEYLPAYTCRDITKEEDDANTRIVFSTYQTIINRIEHEERQYTIGHFDLIIVDEAHRSIYNKYRSIFDYFDSLVLGLTATPRDDVDFDTFEFFDHSPGEPLYSYDLLEASEENHLLLPKGKSIELGFIRRGIRYSDLSDEEKRRYEETFSDEHGEVPDFISPQAINEWLFNEDTVKKVLETLMRDGIKVDDRVGKTIVFAKNRQHAELITKIFNKQYPHYGGDFCQTVHYKTEKSGDLIDKFKDPGKLPRIAVSVDMLDTGIDVLELVNLVFFKPVYSRSKYWQMVGRGTRKCADLFGPGEDKEYFYIFDFCGNFEFFELNPEGFFSANSEPLSQRIFRSWIDLSFILNEESYKGDEQLQDYRRTLLDWGHFELKKLHDNKNNISVRRVLETVLNYLDRAEWDHLDQADRGALLNDIAPIVEITEPDVYAKRFDYFIHQMQIALLSEDPDVENYRIKLVATAESLNQLHNVPEVQKKLSTIKAVLSTEFWKTVSIISIEKVRNDLRKLIQFIDRNRRRIYHTNFADTIDKEIEVEDPLGIYNRQHSNYRKRLELLLEEHRDHLAIRKIRNVEQITDAELKALQEILLNAVREDQKEGLLEYLDEHSLSYMIKTMLGLEKAAVERAFALFEQTHRLSDIQMQFIKEIVNAISVRGVLDVGDLYDGRPFKAIHSGGIEAIFQNDDVDEVIKIVKDVNSIAL